MKLLFHLSLCAFLFACNKSYRSDPKVWGWFAADLTQDLGFSHDSLRVAWISSLGWEWRTLIYDMDDNGIVLGAYLIHYNEKLNSRDTVHVDSSALLSESYSLLSKITNPPFIRSKEGIGFEDGNLIYIAKKGQLEATFVPGVIRIWWCNIDLFSECIELSDLLEKIHRPYSRQNPADFLTKDLESSFDSLRMAWFTNIRWHWYTLIYDMDGNGIMSGANLILYNEKLNTRDTMRVDSTALASEAYSLLTKIDVANLSPVTSKKILWEDGDGPMIYFAKKGIDTTRHCDIAKFPECAKLANLLYRIYPEPGKFYREKKR